MLILVIAAFGAAGFAARADELSAHDAASAHASTQDSKQPSAATHAQELIAHVCEACHGKDGNSTDPNVPSLAGQESGYLQNQLAGFQAQRRVGVMSSVAMNLTRADIRDAATYFSQQILRAGPIETGDSSAVRRGRAIYNDGIASIDVPACASCHALNGAGLPSAFPRLAGQHSRYIAAQLRAFRSDSRLSTNRMMQDVSAKLSDGEIGAVADYIAGMQTDYERGRPEGRSKCITPEGTSPEC
ncbi:MAG: c-type cytochrome [Candidatus Eremiobacteraeota bacterium]|nr:c-type cytochrome [Candidatus Eremiobacteraeota bacterium]